MTKDDILRRSLAKDIKIMTADLNERVKAAAKAGLTTEYLLDAVEDDNAYHQTLRVVVSERF